MSNFFEGPSTKENVEPSFEELKSALPEEMRDEFLMLGNEVFHRSMQKEGRELLSSEDEESKQLEELSVDEEKKLFDRYNEIVEIAKSNLEKK